ncbi:malonate--CoA ligase [Hoeflea prorocentri]|uniref:Malonyl-CoA synthase n=1 Tax=Hoeflea prorocentri TaxID=1922333 RepID=A0A9X3ZHR4_9HYPH|nr:malonyl-CoA synthase [Hoeflea prorocentri]MCY6381106.1 malonyl-CoA synthase [Hoeflea prorocentri]MDA5398906.1 malonyl-CoA synthase [Hoeflea prorocentri]
MANPLYDSLFAPHRGNSGTFLHLKNGSAITYEAFLLMAGTFANAIRDAGLEPGDRLALQVAKSPQAFAVYAACVSAGVVFLPLNTAYTPAEIEYFLHDSGAKLLLCDDGAAGALAPIAAKTGASLMTLNADGSGSFAQAAKEKSVEFVTVERSGDDLAALLYTSGTTGRSKGAMLTQNNLLSNAQTLVDFWHFTSKDVLLHALPIFHTHGLFVAMNVSLLAGCQVIFLPAFNVDDLVEHLPKSTSMMGVPTFYTRLLDDGRFTGELASHVRLFVSGSAPLLAETHIAFEGRTGHRILERYGMTETNMNTSNPYDGERRAGTVGFPLPGVELRVADPESGKPVATGEIGVIEVRGPNVFVGYWQMPEKTKEEFRDDGFFITGDLGRVDEDGYVHIVGRQKDLIISGGYNIYPKEIELLLDEQDGVLESAVIGVPHPDFGEGVIGLVVPERGRDLAAEEIMAAIDGQIARFKQPKRLVIVDELPRNTMGKVQKNVLREKFGDLLSG